MESNGNGFQGLTTAITNGRSAFAVNGRNHHPFGQTRVTVVADDPRAAAANIANIRRIVPQPIVVEAYATARAGLQRDRDDLLVLNAGNHPETEAARQLIQELMLQKYSCQIVVLASEGAQEFQLLELVERGVQVLFWPRDASVLSQLAKNRQARPRLHGMTPPQDESVEGQIARKLLHLTPSLVPMVEKLALAAQHDVTVLITGETGTGKTYLARLIHDFSPRAADRFLIVPCGALAPNLVESEFFGHVKGAFTGADRNKVGKFAAAGNGTLLLDEVDALGLEQQANLLRVVETGEYEPVGSTETQKSTCRLVVASNRNLKDEAEKGKFRQDLYYRFNVMSFHLPPLRERVEDIAPLVRGIVARFNAKFRKDLFEISAEAMAALESYPWPGNIREIENALQSAVLMCQGSALLVKHLPEVIQTHALPPQTATISVDTLVHNREVIERNVIQRALANHGFSRARAALELGISRVTLYKKMKKYGLMKESTRGVVTQ